MNEKHMAFRLLVLITTPKLSEKATEVFAEEELPVAYRLNAQGTATSEIMDMLGLGSIDKNILLGMMPKEVAGAMLGKLAQRLKFGTANSGIAFTIPMTGTSNLLLRILESLHSEYTEETERKDDTTMSDTKYALIAAVVNRGYSNEVMDAAKEVGASGGSVLNSRRIADEEAATAWGLSVQEEKEIILIVANSEKKVDIMRKITEHCGIHSDAKGVVMSLPIDAVMGLQGK